MDLFFKLNLTLWIEHNLTAFYVPWPMQSIVGTAVSKRKTDIPCFLVVSLSGRVVVCVFCIQLKTSNGNT